MLVYPDCADDFHVAPTACCAVVHQSSALLVSCSHLTHRLVTVRYPSAITSLEKVSTL